ncbi:helix-turn-helix domain-containing protein [Streptomyces sp. NRRL WC-3549]|uniref:helix-turn-helix domain-containing protein n=1 Tax=Streptomyces sp. NRRL WC-3549 TaxID=1463925 RepID=UPI0004C4AE5C|nr:helix-turn-helix transcriptional regulator [Streptomyces sp. NRRL WC-3549]
MGTEEVRAAHPHGRLELCDAAVRLYGNALRHGRIARSELADTPCLTDMSLLLADPQDSAWMRPVPPSAALAQLLQPLTRELDERVRLASALSRSLVPLTTLASTDPDHAITVLDGRETIEAALRESTAAATDQVLTAQPGSNRPEDGMERAIANARTAIGRGARLRHIYQHPVRYSPTIRAYLDLFPPDQLRVRTTELTVERLIIFDRTVAYIPASPDRVAALQIRHPALVAYLTQVYEVLWAQATPYAEQLPTTTPGAPVTAVQQSVARLLAEGHVDDVVARKLGISVRTCRSHVSKLMQTLGAHSRTHLGALLVRSGIANPEPAAATRRPAPGA